MFWLPNAILHGFSLVRKSIDRIAKSSYVKTVPTSFAMLLVLFGRLSGV